MFRRFFQAGWFLCFLICSCHKSHKEDNQTADADETGIVNKNTPETKADDPLTDYKKKPTSDEDPDHAPDKTGDEFPHQDPGNTNNSGSNPGAESTPQVPVTLVTPDERKLFLEPIEITLKTDIAASSFYTLDGSDPKVSGIPYQKPILAEFSTVLKFYSKTTTAEEPVKEMYFKIDYVRKNLLFNF